jgi:hypothetical protein
METLSEQYIEEARPEEKVYELITQGQIDTILAKLQSEFDIDLERVTIHSTKPGDPLFDQYEIQHKLLQKYGSNFEALLTTIQRYGYNPSEITVEELRNVASNEGIILDGSLPGFAMTAGDDEIIFFAVKGSNAIEMAKKYAAKEGESLPPFTDTECAIIYLRWHAERAFFHEVAHIIYSRGEFPEWESYIRTRPEITKKVIELQSDKYSDVSSIPIAEEAFAEFAVAVLSDDLCTGRLGENREATEKVRKIIKTKGNVAHSQE